MLACIKKKLVLGLPAFFAPHLLANNTINGSYTQPFALCSLSQGTYPFVVCCGVLQSHKSCHLSLFSLFPFNSWNNNLYKIWYFWSKLFWTTVRKNCSSYREKPLKFETEGQEFAKFLRSLEQFIQTVKGQNNFW